MKGFKDNTTVDSAIREMTEDRRQRAGKLRFFDAGIWLGPPLCNVTTLLWTSATYSPGLDMVTLLGENVSGKRQQNAHHVTSNPQ